MKRLFAPAIAAVLLTACAGITAPGATKSQTPQQGLASSANAMGQLKSARFDVNGTVNITLPQALVDQLKAKGGSQAAILTTNMTVTLKINGAAQKPDHLQATVSAKLGGLTLNTEVIALGGTVYYKDPMTSRWAVLKRPSTTEPKAAAPKLSYQTILDTAKSVTELTANPATLNNVTVEQYRIVPDLAKLFAAISARNSGTTSPAMTALQTVLQNANVSADVWTGKDDHLVRRVSYDADLTGDLSQLLAGMTPPTATSKAPAFSLPAGSIAHLTAHVVVDLHDFNTAIKIVAPTVGS
ncbi:MAG: hypothetical protein M3Z11_07135 [Candidatus Dormibacteraeota bacterium]|nr:hypothetical protein [Candidatus Dormibacteraeota bacterium]